MSQGDASPQEDANRSGARSKPYTSEDRSPSNPGKMRGLISYRWPPIIKARNHVMNRIHGGTLTDLSHLVFVCSDAGLGLLYPFRNCSMLYPTPFFSSAPVSTKNFLSEKTRSYRP